jgi:hypothetical protein
MIPAVFLKIDPTICQITRGKTPKTNPATSRYFFSRPPTAMRIQIPITAKIMRIETAT